MDVKEKHNRRVQRHRRVRAVAHGTQERPRLHVFRSNKHTYAQLINDETGEVLASVSDAKVRHAQKDGPTDLARKVGKEIARRAEKQDVGGAVFDRGGYRYHGRVRAVAEGAREQGLQI